MSRSTHVYAPTHLICQTASVVVVATLLLALPAAAQDFGALDFPAAVAEDGKLVFSFDESAEDWRALDGGTGVKAETEPTAVKEGKGALRYDYQLREGAMSVLCRGGLSTRGAKSVSFWIRASRPTMFGLAIIEKDGSNYFMLFGMRPDAWQKISYDFDELQLQNTSVDENETLDADQIHAMALVDAAVFAAAKDPMEQPNRTVWIDEVTFSPESTRPPMEAGRVVLDGFEELSGRWAAISIKGKGDIEIAGDTVLDITHEKENVKVGEGALEFRYRPVQTAAAALFGSTTLRLKAPRSVSAWIKASKPTVVAWVLSERDGSRYLLTVPVAAGQWRHVQVGLHEFSLDKGAKDENGQLDGDQVNSIGFADAGAAFGRVGLNEDTSRILWIDDLVASEEEPAVRHAEREEPGGKAVIADDFERGTTEWTSLSLLGLAEGKPALALDKDTRIRVVDKGAPQGERALEVAYFAPEGGLVAVRRSLGKLPVEGATQLRLQLKSKYDAKLLLQLAEADGSAYNHVLDVGGGARWRRIRLLLSEFKLADDKVDENGKLDRDQVRQILLVDLSGLTGEPGENVIWLDDLAFFIPKE